MTSPGKLSSSDVRGFHLAFVLLMGSFRVATTVPARKDGAQPLVSALTTPLHGQIHRKESPQPLPYHPGSTTLLVIPDTEVYANKQPQTFNPRR